MQPPRFITPNNRVLPVKDLRPQVILAYRQSPCIIGGRLHHNLIHYDCINPASARGKYVCTWCPNLTTRSCWRSRRDRLIIEAVCAAATLPGNLTQPVRILAGTGN
ncbi:hypothetical protein BDV09DRAFT_144953 [Aspergillus tetrazonus]